MKKNIVMKNRTIECRIGSQLRVFYNYVCTLRKGAAFFYDNTNLGINDTIEEMFLKEQGWYHKNLSDVNKMLKKVRPVSSSLQKNHTL